MTGPAERGPTPGAVELVTAIERLADLAADYLTPTVRFVGHRDRRYAWLERAFAGLVHERRHSGLPAEVVVFNELPHEHLCRETPLGADAAYLFCLETPEPLTDEARALLGERLAVTLVQPNAETLLWHMRALMALRELSYRNGRTEHVVLASVDPAHRSTLAVCVRAVLERRSLHVRVPDGPTRETLLAFLFGTMPPSIAPARVRASVLETGQLHTDRISLVEEHDLDEAAVAVLLERVRAERADAALLVVSVRDAAGRTDGTSAGEADPVPEIAPGRLLRCADDARLLAYWCAAHRRHGRETMRFYAESLIEAQRHAHPDPHAFIASLLAIEPSERSPDTALRELVDTYRRFSLDAILVELERATMATLRRRSARVETAGHAAGISRITFHKRERRHAERPGLLGLHAGDPGSRRR